MWSWVGVSTSESAGVISRWSIIISTKKDQDLFLATHTESCGLKGPTISATVYLDLELGDIYCLTLDRFRESLTRDGARISISRGDIKTPIQSPS